MKPSEIEVAIGCGWRRQSESEERDMMLELTESETRTLLAALLIAIGGDTAIIDDLESESSWQIPLRDRRDRMSRLEKKIRNEYELR